MPLFTHENARYGLSIESVSGFCATKMLNLYRYQERGAYYGAPEIVSAAEVLGTCRKVLFYERYYPLLLLAPSRYPQVEDYLLGNLPADMRATQVKNGDGVAFTMLHTSAVKTDLPPVFKKMPEIPTPEEGKTYRHIMSQWWNWSRLPPLSDNPYLVHAGTGHRSLSLRVSEAARRGSAPRAKAKFCEPGGHYGPAAYKVHNHRKHGYLPWWAAPSRVSLNRKLDMIAPKVDAKIPLLLSDHWDLFTHVPWEMYSIIWELAKRQAAGVTSIKVRGGPTLHFNVVAPLIPSVNHHDHHTTLAVLSRKPITTERVR